MKQPPSTREYHNAPYVVVILNIPMDVASVILCFMSTEEIYLSVASWYICGLNTNSQHKWSCWQKCMTPTPTGFVLCTDNHISTKSSKATLIARFMGPTWGPSGADTTEAGPMLAPWILLSGQDYINTGNNHNNLFYNDFKTCCGEFIWGII